MFKTYLPTRVAKCAGAAWACTSIRLLRFLVARVSVRSAPYRAIANPSSRQSTLLHLGAHDDDDNHYSQPVSRHRRLFTLHLSLESSTTLRSKKFARWRYRLDVRQLGYGVRVWRSLPSAIAPFALHLSFSVFPRLAPAPSITRGRSSPADRPRVPTSLSPASP